MGIFMPADISHRITMFMSTKYEFPFIKKDEIMASFYLFGKDYGVEEGEISAVTDIAKRTVEQVAKDVRLYSAMPQKMDARFTRENYTKRSLQIVVDGREDRSEIVNRKVVGDPTILSDCFAQHLAYHKQRYIFELFQPFKAARLPAELRDKLKGRMLLLGFNVRDRQSLPFKSSLEPFFKWMIATLKI